MEFLKVDPRFDEHPDIEEAGWIAGQLFHFLLRLSARLDLHGRFDARRLDPRWLAKKWNLPSGVTVLSPEDVVADGLKSLELHGLLVRDGDELIIEGWDSFYKPSIPGSVRTKNWRNGKRSCDARDDDASHVTRVTSCDARDATPHHSTPLHKDPPTPQLGGAGSCETEIVTAPDLQLRREAFRQPPSPAVQAHADGPALCDRMDSVFRQQRGADYAKGRNDEIALGNLVKHGDAEVLRRWGIALAWRGYPSCNTWIELAKNWNAYARAQDSPASKPKGDRARI